MNNKPEILAPVGSEESLRAAVLTGADAVYFGTRDFNARKNADNFTTEQLSEAVKYCHSRGVKVYITLNTLINDDEIQRALDTVKEVADCGADGIIVQDIGLLKLVRKCAPEMECHASTQMSVQTLSGISLVKDMGCSRVVLARESTKKEIEELTVKSEIETEVFVHGAHCMSVSGQCYMSSMFGSRSGNRGLCAQPCRLPFSVKGGTGADLSLKDLSLIDKAEELASMGVASFKIEGRMKRPEYVAAAVTTLKEAVQGEDYSKMAERLRAVFSRSGFSDGYYENKPGREMFGTRQKQDVTAMSNEVLKSLSSLYEKEVPRFPVDFCLNIEKDERVSLSAASMGKSCFIRDDIIPERAINKPLESDKLKESLSKCGGTQFFSRNIEIVLDEGLIVPRSVINSLRRRALEELEKQLCDVKGVSFTPVKPEIPSHSCKGALKYNIRVAHPSQIPSNLQNVENLYIPLNVEEKTVEKVKNLPVNVGFEVPRAIFGKENVVERLMLQMKNRGISIAYCSTLDAVAIAIRMGFIIHTGFSMNVFNSVSAAVLEELGVKSLTLSPELTLSQLSKIGTEVKRGIIGYGRLPLMLVRNCPVKNGISCEECKGKSFLSDRKGMKFPVVCSFGASEILNSCPIYMADRLSEISGMDFITFYFTKEAPEMCEQILEAYRKNKKVKGDYTRGLYYRGAL